MPPLKQKSSPNGPNGPKSYSGCYGENSTDTRCCGLCFCFCPAKNISKDVDLKRCDFCPNDFSEYWYSGYIQTTASNTKQGQAEDINGVCCWLCFPIKFPMFFPCFLGSLANGCINKSCATTCCATVCGGCAAPIQRNYLF